MAVGTGRCPARRGFAPGAVDHTQSRAYREPMTTTRQPAVNIIQTPGLPMRPSVGANARRQVRHGLADVLEWLGETVGPAPYDPIHFFIGTGTSVSASNGGEVIYSSMAGLSMLHRMAEMMDQ